MNTQEYRAMVWTDLTTNHPDAKLAMKGYGRIGYKYTTVRDHAQTHIRPELFNHRGVLPHELVADFDCAESELGENVVGFIESLDQKELSYSVWRTNTDKGGVHVHIYWDIPSGVQDPKLLKRLLLEHLVPDPQSMGLDPQVLGNHLIRFEGGAYDKLPPWQAGVKTLLFNRGEPLQKNKVPQEVWDKYGSHLLKYTLAGLRRKKYIEGQAHTPKSILFMLSERFKEYKDGGKRGLFILASYYRRLDEEELYKVLREWANYNTKEKILDRTIQQMVKRAKSFVGRPVGERYRKEYLKSIRAYDEVYPDEKTNA